MKRKEDDKEQPEVAPESGDKLVNIEDEEADKGGEAFPPESERPAEAAGEDFE